MTEIQPETPTQSGPEPSLSPSERDDADRQDFQPATATAPKGRTRPMSPAPGRQASRAPQGATKRPD